MMQPDRVSWRIGQQAAAYNQPAGSRHEAAGHHWHSRESGTRNDAPLAPQLGIGYANGASQSPDLSHDVLGAAIAKLQTCAGAGAPVVSAAANRVYQDALTGLNSALTQVQQHDVDTY